MLTTRLLLIVLALALTGASPSAETARQAEARLQADVDVIKAFRPAYPFWQHIFTIPDGRIAFGSARRRPPAGNLPLEGGLVHRAPSGCRPDLGTPLTGVKWPLKLDDRRDLVGGAPRAEPRAAPPQPDARTVPVAEHPALRPLPRRMEPHLRALRRAGRHRPGPGLLESGLNGTARSKANALGLCQWLRRNWQTLDRLSPVTIEAYNQTTQASYCAAYLSILATMYGSFIPALSEHHSGGVNVGRAIINGERLGGATPQEQYFKGSQFAHDLRAVDLKGYRDLYRTYGVRSFRYAEMVFGNTATVTRIRSEIPQQRIHAMRTRKTLLMGEITHRTKLTAIEVQRFNPALTRSVPANATLYLPDRVPEFGEDVSFWQRPPGAAFTSALDAFLELDSGVQRWHEASFEPVLQDFRERFEATGSEEGSVMATDAGVRHRRPADQPARRHPRRLPHQRQDPRAVSAGARGTDKHAGTTLAGARVATSAPR